MSGRYWLLVIALGGCLSGIPLDAKQASAEPEDLEWVEVRSPAVKEDTTDQPNTDQRGTPQFPLQVRIVEDPDEAESGRRREANSDQREQDDLIEQRRSADAATRSADSAEWQEYLSAWQIILAGVGTAAFLYSLGLTRQANAAALEGVAIAQRSLVASQRPWLSVSVSLISDLKIKNEEGRISILFEVKNHGTSPAIGVHIDAEFIDMFPVADSSIESRNRLLKNARAGSAQRHGLLGRQIFPGESIPSIRSMPLRKDNDLPEKVSALGSFNSTLIAAISYKSIFDEEILITEVRRTLGQRRDDNPGLFVGINIEDGVVRQDRLILAHTLGDGTLN